MAGEHFAGDFGVDGVGVVEQRGREECEGEVEDDAEREQDEAIAAGLFHLMIERHACDRVTPYD